LKLADPVTDRAVGAATAIVALVFSMSDEKTYVPPVRESVAPAFTVTLPYAPAPSVFDAPEFNVMAVVPAVAGGSAGNGGITGNAETGPWVAPALPETWFASTGPTDAPLFRKTLYA
jgi:hypothetical protein